MGKINNKWVDPDAWAFHITSKNLIREAINSGVEEERPCKKLEILKGLIWKDEWIKNEGEPEPPNTELMRKLWEEYFEWAKKEGIPIWEKAFLEKAGKFVVALFKQDSAYFERIGGVITFMYYNKYNWVNRSKDERLALLRVCREWWHTEDQRERTKGWILNLFNCVINGYEKREFWTKSIDFIIDWLYAHQEEWVNHEVYDPKKWFVRGRGQINIKLHGDDA